MGEDEVVGVPMKRAAEIIDVSRSRLVSWASIGLLTPASLVDIGAQHRWLYSIDELAAGRVARQFELAGISINHVAWVVRRYRSAECPAPLVNLRWGIDRAARKVFANDGKGWMDGDQPHQGVMPEVVDIAEIRALVQAEARRRRGQAGQTSRDRGKFGSKPVFEGTRVPVAAVRSWLEHGATNARILEAYPSLQDEDVDLVRRELQEAG